MDEEPINLPYIRHETREFSLMKAINWKFILIGHAGYEEMIQEEIALQER